jgi:LysR family transcriptional regulator, glycine cleavage system transcriptional activator
MPPLTALRSFEAAARHGSFRDAAEELCVSHSAISHQIKLLENTLDVELFTRKSRAVELTKLGKTYYPVLRDAFDKIAEGTELLLAPQSPGVLTIQLYSTFAIRWLIPRLTKFYAAHPNIQVRLNTSQADVDFEHEDVDMCVMLGARSSVDLHYDYLFTSDLFPVASPGLIEEKGLKTLDDLKGEKILQVYPSEKDWYVWLDDVGVSGVDPQTGLQFDSYDHALMTAMQGLGVALGMQPYVERDLASGLLVELFPEQRVQAIGEWYLVCRQERTDNKKLVAFREWLLSEVQADEDLLKCRR